MKTGLMVDRWLKWRSGHRQDINHRCGDSKFCKGYRRTVSDGWTPVPLDIIHHIEGSWRKMTIKTGTEGEGGQRGNCGGCCNRPVTHILLYQTKKCHCKAFLWWKTKISLYTQPHDIIWQVDQNADQINGKSPNWLIAWVRGSVRQIGC